jgi:hypothetical protein
MPQSSCSRGSSSSLGCSSGEKWHELRVVQGSNGAVYFLKRVFKQCRKAGRSTWQSPGFPWPLYWDWLSPCYGYEPKCGTSCSRGPGFPSPSQRQNRVVQQLSFWTVAISLRAVAQKLQWLCSFPRGFGGPEGFPHLPLFYFLWKRYLEIFLFCGG